MQWNHILQQLYLTSKHPSSEVNVFAKSYLMSYFVQPLFHKGTCRFCLCVVFRGNLNRVFVRGANFILDIHRGIVKLISLSNSDIDTLNCLIKSENECMWVNVSAEIITKYIVSDYRAYLVSWSLLQPLSLELLGSHSWKSVKPWQNLDYHFKSFVSSHCSFEIFFLSL